MMCTSYDEMFTRSKLEPQKGVMPGPNAERESSARQRVPAGWRSPGGSIGQQGRAETGACTGASRMNVERYLDRIAGRVR